jgi:hypothetical protein
MPPKPKPSKRVKPKKKRPASERKVLVKTLDDLVSLIVRKRDGKCVTPGNCHGFLTASHYYKRENWGIRWNLINVNCQCASMNGAHRFNEFRYSQFMQEKYGAAVFGMLLDEEAKYRAGEKWTVPQLRELLETMKIKYERMNQ